MTKIEECENCGAKEETVKGYSVWIKKSGTGAMFKLCPKCVRLAKEDKLPFRIIDRSYIKREEKVEEPPKICPLLSIAPSSEGLNADCEKEKCWLYSRKLKMCAFVIMAHSMSNIAMMWGREALRDLIKKP